MKMVEVDTEEEDVRAWEFRGPRGYVFMVLYDESRPGVWAAILLLDGQGVMLDTCSSYEEAEGVCSVWKRQFCPAFFEELCKDICHRARRIWSRVAAPFRVWNRLRKD